MATIFYVHGSGGSENSFTWLRQQLTPHTAKFFSYQVTETTESCVGRLLDAIAAESEPVTLIGHSLGGIIALACAGRSTNIRQLITLCAPFAGLKHANLAALFSNAPMFRDLQEYGRLLIGLRTVHITAAHLAIVATHGLPHLNEPNDGVVTVSSQTALSHQIYHSYEVNHFEVLLSPDVAATINQFRLTG
jgi:pimeloyl-ACP methyl ester carboxylesterase